MRILTWNIQCGKNCSGHTELNKTIDHIKSLGELDIICLQEVSRNMELYSSHDQPDQRQVIEHGFTDYTSIWGHGFSWPNLIDNSSQRREFGNITLVKSSLVDFRVHPLPRPSTPNKRQMQRVAIEAMVNSPMGILSIINTHLAFHDDNENQLQTERLDYFEKERRNRMNQPGEMIAGCYEQAFEPIARILCGDFNFDVDSNQYRYLIENNWLDAWRQAHNNGAHAPTCGIFDTVQWPQGSHCRDFFWLSNELLDTTTHVIVDVLTDLSDHQPVILELEC